MISLSLPRNYCSDGEHVQSLLLSLRHALPHAPDRAVLHFAVEVHARAVQDSEPLVPRLLVYTWLLAMHCIRVCLNSVRSWKAGSMHEEMTNWRGASRNTVTTMSYTPIAASNMSSSPERGSDRNARMPS